MFCKNCGGEVDSNAYVCIHCGALIKEDENAKKSKKENAVWAILGLIFGILGGLIGLVSSIVGLCVYEQGSQNRTLCYIGLGCSIFWIFAIIVASLA